jgi:hypothetical protein
VGSVVELTLGLGIPTKFRTKPFHRREKCLEFCTIEQIEANFRNKIANHFVEEIMLSILFAGSGNFRFESLPKISKIVSGKTTFEVWTNPFAKLFWLFCLKKFFA